MKIIYEVGDKVWYDDAESIMPWYSTPVRAKVIKSDSGHTTIKIKKADRSMSRDADGIWSIGNYAGYRITPRD